MGVNRIDKRLYMVVPIYADVDVTQKDAKPTAYVHSAAITAETFDKYWEVIGVTFTSIYNRLGVTAGARVAHKMLEKVAKNLGVWDGPDGVAAGLLPTIHQRTNVACVGKNGWEIMTLGDARAAGVLNAEDFSVVEAAIVFFTVASSMHRKAELLSVMGLASVLWGVQIESLNCTEFVNSLRTATLKESSGGTVIALSAQSSTG
jgi:hypothetical protein